MQNKEAVTPERWRRIQQLFDAAFEVEESTRLSWLAAECGEDENLRAEVLALLRSAEENTRLERELDRAVAGAALDLDELPPGRKVGRYRIVRLLGRGGMGAVYLAERVEGEFEQQVALKLIGRALPGSALTRRFRAERQILAQLNHPNIARLLDGGASEDGVPYLAMEYVEGERIDAYCERQGLDVPARLRLFQHVCAAIQYAHQNLVVHRDIKPSNILVGAGGAPKLLDFGIAKLLDAEQGVTAGDELTRVHERVLTPEHASPEQVRGEPIGTASDVYALGVLLYELLTGARPYAVLGRSMEELERIICTMQPLRPSAAAARTGRRALARSLAGDLDNIVLKAMHKESQRRYASAAALAEDVQNHLDERPVQARPDAWTYRAGKFIRRNAVGLSAALGVAAAMAAMVVYYTIKVTHERDVAERERQTSAEVSEFMQEVFRVANPSESRGNSVTVREVLDTAVKRIDTELQAEPRVRATLLRTMGQVYNGLGLWTQARELLERAVDQERASFGDEHLELAQALGSLAGVNHNLSRFDVEQKLYEEAWRIRRALGRDRDAQAAQLLSAMANGLRAQQRFEEALVRHAEAEAAARALSPPAPEVLGQVLQGYAMTHHLMGNSSLAERYARDSLVLVRDVTYEGNDLYANSINTLAEALRRQYRLEEAAALHRELLALQISRLGEDAPMVARTLNNLSHILRASGDYDGAHDALSRAVSSFRAQFGEDNFDIAISWHNLGALLVEAGRCSESLEPLERSLALKRQLTGARSPHVVSTLLEISAARRELGDLSGAQKAFGEAQSVARETYSARDGRHAVVAIEAARLALARGDVAAGVTAAREALGRTDQHNPARLALAQSVLADALVASGAHAEARTLAQAALDTRRRIMPKTHWMIADAESRLGAALHEVAPAEARPLLERGAARLRASRPEGDSARAAAERRLDVLTRTPALTRASARPLPLKSGVSREP